MADSSTGMMKSIIRDAHRTLIAHFLCISTVPMSSIKNHIPLFIHPPIFSVQIDFFRQDEIPVRIRTDHSQSLKKESVVEKP